MEGGREPRLGGGCAGTTGFSFLQSYPFTSLPSAALMVLGQSPEELLKKVVLPLPPDNL